VSAFGGRNQSVRGAAIVRVNTVPIVTYALAVPGRGRARHHPGFPCNLRLMSPGVSPLDAARDLFGTHLEGLAGGVVSGEIPLTVEVINRMIARKLAASPSSPVTTAEVEAHETETFTVHLRVRAPLPAFKIDVRIDHQPQLPRDSTMGLRWSVRGLGPLGMFAAPIASYFKGLPDGLRLEGDRVWVDLHTLLRAQGLGELVPLLSGVRVITRERRFVIQFELRR
jgi:hypothetical protein